MWLVRELTPSFAEHSFVLLTHTRIYKTHENNAFDLNSFAQVCSA